MAGRYGRRYMKDEDFDEGEVWGAMEERETSSPKLIKPIKDSSFSVFSSSSSRSSAPRIIPKSSVNSNSFHSLEASRKQSSAPVDIPDWSKIYGKGSKKKNNNINHCFNSSSSWVISNGVDVDGCYANYGVANYNDGDGDGDDDGHGDNGYDHDDDNDDDDDDDGIVPPHEFLARKLARTQISSFSVYEGIGRTLKGRDLSKVRNAILTKTGFLE